MSNAQPGDETGFSITVGEHRKMCADLDRLSEEVEGLKTELGDAKGAVLNVSDLVARVREVLFVEPEEQTTDEMIDEISRIQMQRGEAVRKAEAVLGTNETLGEVNGKLTQKLASLELQQGQSQGTIKRLERELEVDATRQKKLDRLESFLEEARLLVIELGADDRRAGDPDGG